MNKSLYVLVGLSLLLQPLAAAAKESPSPRPPKPTPSSSVKAAKLAAQTTGKVADLQKRGDKEIDRRVESLQKLLARINELKKLSAESKLSFGTKIEAEITGLNILKAKIDADTDLDTLRTDVKSIVDSYRVYAIFVPQIHILAAGDKLSETADKFTELANKLEKRIATVKATGTSTATMETSLAEMKNMIADAKTQAEKAKTTVINLDPAGYPDNKSSLKAAQDILKTAREDLTTAHNDAQSIIKGLKGEDKISPLPASSAAAKIRPSTSPEAETSPALSPSPITQ